MQFVPDSCYTKNVTITFHANYFKERLRKTLYLHISIISMNISKALIWAENYYILFEIKSSFSQRCYEILGALHAL